jgi:hypothetical protein
MNAVAHTLVFPKEGHIDFAYQNLPKPGNFLNVATSKTDAPHPGSCDTAIHKTPAWCKALTARCNEDAQSVLSPVRSIQAEKNVGSLATQANRHRCLGSL